MDVTCPLNTYLIRHMSNMCLVLVFNQTSVSHGCTSINVSHLSFTISKTLVNALAFRNGVIS